MAGFKKVSLDRGQLKLSVTATTTTGTADTYTKVLGTFINGASSNFIVSGNKLIYQGVSGQTFLFSGASDVEVDKSCVLTYALFVNDTLLTGAETPHTFTAASKLENISITAIVTLNHGDEIDVYVKSSVDNTDVDPATLIITFLGTGI